ncbi:MAG TPA: glycosyltransferase 87 family protein [Acidimicrobiales bacterium]|nr:glycosyltransferase 87 family protein [Acidimicrobiales bacterium]
MTSGLRAGAVRVVSSWGPEERDAVLYSGSALFAISTAQVSSITLYQQWGKLATGPYVVGAMLSALAARRLRRRPAPLADPGTPSWHWTTPRTVIFLLVLLGATLMPLSLEVLWRTDAGGTSHVQPEVVVVEHSGARVLHGQDPYQVVDGGRTKVTAPAGQAAYVVYNPYLPLMSVFGIAHGTKAPARLTDARVIFSLMTIVVVVVALAMCRGPTGPRVLALQSMTVLPTAALPLATGGDDLPVAALMLLALVLLQRRRPLASGITLGIAASMKITAWPLAAIGLLAARQRDGRQGRRPVLLMAAGMAGVMLPAILPTALSNVAAFVDNVVRFPLGLAGISSPAASPLLGHAVVSAFPAVHRIFPVAVAGIGGALLLYVLVRRTPRTPAAVAQLLGWAMTVAILMAPATRIGYFLYPVDFFVWAWLLRNEGAAEDRAGAEHRPGLTDNVELQDWSDAAKSRSDIGVTPAAGTAMPGTDEWNTLGETVTPSSHS